MSNSKDSNSGISRRDFIRRSSIGLAGLAIASNSRSSILPSVDKVTKAKSTNPYTAWRTSSFMPEIPHRLSQTVHKIAEEGFSGKLGKELKNPDWDYSEVKNSQVGPQERYGLAALSVAKNAPLRFIEGELIVGSASLLPAAHHQIPCMDGVASISHTTLGFEKMLKKGYCNLRKEIIERQKRGGLDAEGEDVLKGMLMTLDAAKIWNDRYVARLEELKLNSTKEDAERYNEQIKIMKKVPENAPENFREAIQSLWSMYAFNRLMGNWSGLGRFDRMLGNYLKQDLKQKKITLDEARELVAHFWAKGTEWIGIYGGSGDAQFYQNVILSGIDKDGKDVTNEVTYLVLDVVEELHISDYPIAVRIGDKTPDKLFRRIAEVQRFGGGIVSIYNENTVIGALTEFGYPIDEAREFTNDGCWEAIIPGKTAFIYWPNDMLPVLSNTLGINKECDLTDSDFESLYKRFQNELAADVKLRQDAIDHDYLSSGTPCALASMFTEGCIEKARCYYNRGPKYSVKGIHYGGVSDVANSLLVIKKLVFDDKYMSLNDFVGILRKNWEGQEGLRKLIQTRFEFYGNDNNDADSMMERVFNDYTSIVGRIKERNGVRRPCGISTFGREIDWRMQRLATAEGSKVGDILATNCSPTPGSDKKGPTSALNSYCKLNFTHTPNGATLELKILPQSVKGENGIRAMMALAKTFREKGGFYMHIDVVDTATLIDAQMHPEKYPNLPVRVAGWSARFTTLCKEWQDMVILRTQQLV